MSILRILAAIALVLTGALFPALDGDPVKAPPRTIGMAAEVFTITEMTVHTGETVTLVNDSRWLHIVGPGEGGSLEEAPGLPMHERVLMESNDKYTTAKWDQPGEYYLTCSIHPKMTVEIKVTDCGGCCSPAGCG